MSSSKCREHGVYVCSQCVVITDAAKRMSDAMKLAVTFHTLAEIRCAWMAFALADGSTDNVLYPSKRAAIAHMSDENRYAYFCLRNSPGGCSPRDAQVWLDLHRYMYDNGARLTDDRTVIMPQGRDQKITRLVIPGPAEMARMLRAGRWE